MRARATGTNFGLLSVFLKRRKSRFRFNHVDQEMLQHLEYVAGSVVNPFGCEDDLEAGLVGMVQGDQYVSDWLFGLCLRYNPDDELLVEEGHLFNPLYDVEVLGQVIGIVLIVMDYIEQLLFMEKAKVDRNDSIMDPLLKVGHE